MTMMTVYRNAAGAIENIGPWDYGVVDAPRRDDEGNPVFDADANPILDRVATNPMPAGLIEDEADIVEGPDGGRYEVGDPRLAPAAPAISDDALAAALAARSGLTAEQAASFIRLMQRPSV